MKPSRVVIVGAGGYSGAELAAILLDHDSAEIVGVFGSARRADTPPSTMADLFPRFRNRLEMPVLPADSAAVLSLKPDVVLLATPHEASLELGALLVGRGPTVLDLSGAFRLKDASLYPKVYGFQHDQPALLARAAYGLPELFSREIKAAVGGLVSVPGCYATCAILPLAPLARAGAIEPGRRPVVDAVSGVSGAGRSPTPKTHFCEVSLQPYNVLRHRHNPEIDAYAGVPVVFTPHLGPYDRGIVSTIHVDLAPGWGGDRVAGTLREAYGAEPFIRLLPAEHWPSVAGVRGTNFCDIAWAVDESHRHLIIVSALDNLVKGAAGQAVQCMNLTLGLDQRSGLIGNIA